MKFSWIVLFLLVGLSSQSQNRVDEIMKIISAQDSIDRRLFLDSSILKEMTLAQSSNWRQFWTGFNDKETKIDQFFDIRLKFENKVKALNFYNKFLKENSEEGPELQSLLKIKGVDSLKVFGQNEKIAAIFPSNGKTQFLCILFVVENYFIKYYITCNAQYKVNDFKRYIEFTRDRIIQMNIDSK